MKIVTTFAVVDDSLYSVLFDTEVNTLDDDGEIISNENSHEFRRLFDLWNDPLRLRDFFEENEADLNEDYWEGISIEEAIFKTRSEAKKIERILLEFAVKGMTQRFENLSTLFKPLSEGRIESEYEQDKVKVEVRRTWLRLYAIRVDLNVFVVCGGAIKLRKTMNDRNYLIKELKKLAITQNFLRNEESDELELFELE